MQAAIIYAKSDTGLDEIRSRSGQLARPMRNLLLCVDGKRSVEELEALVRACGAPPDALQQLQSLGLIHAMQPPLHGEAQTAVVPAEHAQATAAHAAGPDTLQPLDPALDAFDAVAAKPASDYAQLYARMNALVSEHLGLLKSYSLQLKIEQCNSVDQLRALLPDLEMALSKAIGKEKAQSFLVSL
jgi:hypothetical protein